MAWPGSKNVGDEIFPVDFQFGSFSDVGTPASGDKLLILDISAGTYKYVTANNLGGAGGGAPTDATYWVSSANGTLSAEVVVNSLATLNSAISDSLLRATNRSLGLNISDFYFPGSDLTAAIYELQTSSASTPKPHFPQWAFSVNDACLCSFRMPSDYSSAPVIKLLFKMVSATSGNIQFRIQIAAVTSADSQDVDANAFATANDSGNISVPATAGHLKEISFTLTNLDSWAAGDFVVMLIQRVAATSEASGDAQLVAADLQYTAA